MEKQRWEESERRRKEEKDQRREGVRRKKMQVREKVEKSQFAVFFPRFVALECSGGSKSKLAKAADAETFGQMRDEKLHAVVARSTFRSQKCNKLRGTDHFWTFRCGSAWQARGIVHLIKREQNVRVFLWHFQKRWQAWTFEEDLQRCILHGKRSTRDMFIRAVRRSGR